MKIVKLYLSYHLTIFNLIVFCLITTFLGFSYFISINDINEGLSYNAVLKFYFENSIYYTKIIIIFLVVFLFMKLQSERNEHLINVIITAGYNKKSNFKMMILSNLIIIYLIILVSFIMFIVIGFLSKSYFSIKIEYIYFYVNIIIIATYYGLLSYLICLILKSQFLVIVILILFLISELLVNYESIFKYIYLTVLPNINNDNGICYINNIYTIILIIILFFINEKIYLNSDLKM